MVDACLRIRNVKKEENESYKNVLEAVKCLFSEASINDPDTCIGHADRVSGTNDMVIVHSTPHYVLQEKKRIVKWSEIFR